MGIRVLIAIFILSFPSSAVAEDIVIKNINNSATAKSGNGGSATATSTTTVYSNGEEVEIQLEAEANDTRETLETNQPSNVLLEVTDDNGEVSITESVNPRTTKTPTPEPTKSTEDVQNDHAEEVEKRSLLFILFEFIKKLF